VLELVKKKIPKNLNSLLGKARRPGQGKVAKKLQGVKKIQF
jgi:hypothetical protein